MLVHVVNRQNQDQYSGQLAEMFRRRHEVFVQKKRWALQTVNSPAGPEERDEFDQIAEVEYLIMLDSDGKQLASTRFLPSTGPHLTSGPLKHFFAADRPAPVGSDCWEISRGISSPAVDHPEFARCKAVMATAYIEWAIAKGVKTIFGIGDDRYVAAMFATGWKVQAHGEMITYPEGGKGMAISWPIDHQTLADTWEACNITAPVLVDTTRQSASGLSLLGAA